MWKNRCCYGYILYRAFRSKKLFKWNGLAFIGVYVINRILHGRMEIRNFSSSVEKYFTSEHESPRGHVISSIYLWIYVSLTGVFFAWACATAEQAICMEAHHRVCFHQNGASPSYHSDYFARWSWRMCSWFNKMCSLQKKTLTWS